MRYLERFLRNLLLGEHHRLLNRELHIRYQETAHSDGKQHIDQSETAHSTEIQHIDRSETAHSDEKQHIEDGNSMMELLETANLTRKTKENILRVREAFGKEMVFSRTDVAELLSITERPATTLINKMRALELIEAMSGFGKGKYRFIV